MKRKALLAAFLLLIPTVQGLSLNKQELTTTGHDLRQVSTIENSTYILSEHSLEKVTDSRAWKKNFKERITGEMDLNSEFIITGTRVSGTDIIILNNEGKVTFRQNTRDWIDNVALFERKTKPVFAASSSPFLKIRKDGNSDSIGYPVQNKPKHLEQRLFNLDSDQRLEGLLSTAPRSGTASVEAFLTSGSREWKYEIESNIRPRPYFIQPDKVLVVWRGSFSLLHSRNGSEVWQRNVEETRLSPTTLEKGFVYSNSTHLVWRDYSGEIVKVNEVDWKVRELAKHPEKPFLIGFQNRNLSVFNLEGERVASSKIGDLEGEIDFYSDGDISVRTDRKVFRVSLENEEDYEGGVFYGKGEAILEAVSLNQTMFVGKEKQSFEDLSSQNLTEATQKTVSEAFNYHNVSSRWYVDSREKAVYAAALAAKEDAVITFEKEDVDRDLSNKTLEELKQQFRERFNPNHLVVADFSSESGVLAAYMAARRGYMPINYEDEIARKKHQGTHNSENRVYELDRRLEKEFELIGNTWKSVSDGRYISLLHAPRKAYKDPVKGIFRDSKDGNVFYSDIVYGNLDEDERIEAAVGRYPEDVSTASVMFHRSLRRDKGSDALVASEYLHGEWPVVLATLGGGVLSGTTGEKILEKEGYETTHLVEQRADPAKLLYDLVGVPDFLRNVNDVKYTLSEAASDSSARLLKNSVIVVKGLEYAEEALKIYLEYEWDDYSSDFEIDVPEKLTVDEVNELIADLLPDRHDSISETNLVNELQSSDIIYYSGSGNQNKWRLPSKSDNSYSRALTPEEVPKTRDSIIFDSSSLGSAKNAEMRHSFLKAGATNFVGFSTVNYNSYSSVIANNFFSHGDTSGKSFLDGVNSLKAASLVYSPVSSHKIGVREKMENSPVMYGNPETLKDPLKRNSLNYTKTCERGLCTVEARIDPNPEVRSSSYIFNTSDYALKPFHPIVPLFSFSEPVPENSELVEKDISEEYVKKDNISVPELNLLSNSGKFRNYSVNYTEFPAKKHGLSFNDRISYVQAAQKVEGNSTLILENANLVLKYRTPLSVEIEESSNEVKARLYSDQRRNLSIIYKVDDDSFRSFETVEGSETISLTQLDPGVHNVEVQAFSKDIKAEDSELVKIKKRANVYLFAPDMDAGAEREVRAIIENPNEFPIKKNLTLHVSGSAALSVLEDSNRNTKVPAEKSKSVKWSVLGVKRGSAEAKLSDNTEKFNVEKARDSNKVISTQQVLKSFSTKGNSINYRRTDSLETLSIKDSDAEFQIRYTPSSANVSLNTDRFSSKISQNYEKKIYRAENMKGSYVRVVSDGKGKERVRNMDEEEAITILEKTLSEARKFERFTSISADETKVFQMK